MAGTAIYKDGLSRYYITQTSALIAKKSKAYKALGVGFK
jgi:hypothetical protein